MAKAGANYMNSQLIKMEALLGGYSEGIALDDRGMPKAEAAAQKAFALDNDLPQASYAMATNNRFDWQWSKAEQGYKHTIELNPNLARAYSGYALFLSVMGRPDEAIAEIKRAREFDPVLILINLNMGVIYYQARRYDEAIDALQKTVELDKNVPFAHMYLGLSYSEKGLHERAIASMQQAIDLNEKTSKMMVMPSRRSSSSRASFKDHTMPGAKYPSA